MNIELIKQIILDNQKQPLPKLTKRDMDLCFIPNMALGITGVRRSGKTYRTYQLVIDMVSCRDNICRIQFNDHRLSVIKANELHIIDEAYYTIYPEKRYKEDIYFIFDEIHRIEGWEDYILYLLENINHKVLITGSSSKLSKGKYASPLRGKFMPSIMYPFSFKEFLRFNKVKIDLISSEGQSYLVNALDKYLLQGGFPGLLEIPEDFHNDLLNTYWDTMLLRDVIEAHPDENINPILLRQFACSLASRNACAMTVSKIAKNLSTAGLQFSNETLYRYLDHLNEAFIFDAVEFYSQSERVRNRNYRKIYCVDWILASSAACGDHQRKTRHFENMIYLELKRRKKDISYYRTRDGYEIDFVVVDTNKIELIQVAYSVNDEDVKSRETRAILKTAKFLNIETAKIITYNESGEINKDGIVIQIIPAWKWLIEKD